MLLIYPFNALNKGMIKSFGFEAYGIPESKNIFPISFTNYSTYDADMFRMILLADLEQVRELKTERDGIEASISRIEKQLKTDKIILMGDVDNIPLLDIHREIISSKINRLPMLNTHKGIVSSQKPHNKDLGVISDITVGENKRGFRELLGDDSLLHSKRDDFPKDLENINAYFWSSVDDENFLIVTDEESRALIDSINNPVLINSIFEKGVVDNNNRVILDRDAMTSLRDEVYGNDIYLDKELIISKIENLNKNLFVDTTQIYSDIFGFISTKVERSVLDSGIEGDIELKTERGNLNSKLEGDIQLKTERDILASKRINNNVALTHREKLKALIDRDGELYVMKEMFFVKPPDDDDDEKIRIPITVKEEVVGELDRKYGEVNSIHSMRAVRESYKEMKKHREHIFKGIRLRLKAVSAKRSEITGKLEDTNNPLYVDRDLAGSKKPPHLGKFIDEELLGLREIDWESMLMDEEFLGRGIEGFESTLNDEGFLGFSREQMESILSNGALIAEIEDSVSKIEKDILGKREDDSISKIEKDILGQKEDVVSEIEDSLFGNREDKSLASLKEGVLGEKEDKNSKIENLELEARVKDREGLLEKLDYISSLVKIDKVSILNDLFFLAINEDRDAILEDGLTESLGGIQSYIMDEIILGNRMNEKDSHTLEFVWESIRDISEFSVLLDKYLNSKRDIKKGLLDKVIGSEKVPYEVQIHEVEVADRVMIDRVVSFVVDLEATKSEKESVLEEVLTGILKEKLAIALNEEEIMGNRILEKNSLLDEYYELSSRISDKLGGLLELDILGNKYHDGEVIEELLGIMDRSWDSALCDLKMDAVQVDKLSILQRILDNANKVKMEAILNEGAKDGFKSDLEAHMEAFDYLSDRILERKSKLMLEDARGLKPALSMEMEEQILGDRETDRESGVMDDILNVDKSVDKGVVIEDIEGVLVDKFAKIEKDILGKREDSVSKIEKDILGKREDSVSKIEKDILGDIVEYEGKEIDGLKALRSLDEKRSELLNNYKWAIGCGSPEEFFPDADVNNPNVDLDTDDPSEDKDHPGRWYDGPKTPIEVLKELLIELKERDQGVIGYPADETAQMIKDIINEVKKHHAHANSEEFKEIINWINALIDSELHNVCELKETILEESIIDYKKDWQNPMEPEGKWKDSEWIGNDTPPEEAGVGNWINVDLTKPSGATKEMLDEVLSKNGGLLSGISQACLDAERMYGVNAIYIASHAIWESGWGKSQISIDKNNLFGYGAYDWSPYESAWTFRSKAHCIDVVAKHVADDYLTPKGPYWGGAPTLKAMNKFYATDIAWANGIGSLMRQFYGGPPPNGLLAGYNQEPYTKWYRYEEPESDAQGWKMLHPEAPVPNFCLHSPDDLEMDEISGIHIKKNSKTGGTIKFRTKIANGDSKEPSDGAQKVIWYDDVKTRPDGYPPAHSYEEPYPTFWGYASYTNGDNEDLDSFFMAKNGQYVTRGSYGDRAFFKFEYEVSPHYDSEIVIGRALKSSKVVPTSPEIIGSYEKYVFKENFKGTLGGSFGETGTFQSSNLNNSGLKYFKGWGFHSGYSGTTLNTIANAEWEYDVDMGPLDGYMKMGHWTWCDPTDNGIQILADGKIIWSYAGKNGVEDPAKVHHNEFYRIENIRIPKETKKITIRAKNKRPGMHIFDAIHLVKKVPKYAPNPAPGQSISRMTVDIYNRFNGTGTAMLIKTVVWEGDVSLMRETIKIPKSNRYLSINIRYDQKQKDNSDMAIIDFIAVYENGDAEDVATSNSTLRYYMDDVFVKEFKALPNWQEASFPIRQGVSKHAWEITQKHPDGKDFALLDDVIISGVEVTKEEYWDCPENTGEDLLDKIIDWLDKKKPLPEEPKNINFKVWLYT